MGKKRSGGEEEEEFRSIGLGLFQYGIDTLCRRGFHLVTKQTSLIFLRVQVQDI